MSESPAQVAPAAETPPPLDDVMLAMDVVDTLRRRERLGEPLAADFFKPLSMVRSSSARCKSR